MNGDRKNAVVVGILLLTAIIAGILSASFGGSLDDPRELLTAAVSTRQVTVGAFLQLIMAFACMGIAIWFYPTLRRHNEALALGAVGFRTIEAVCFILVAATQLSLVALGQQVGRAGDSPSIPLVGDAILAAGAWLTSVSALAFCLGAGLYYVVLYQSRLVPRWLSIWGLIAILLSLFAAILIVFGTAHLSTSNIALSAPIFLNELALAVWLIAKGFDQSAVAAASSGNGVQDRGTTFVASVRPSDEAGNEAAFRADPLSPQVSVRRAS